MQKRMSTIPESLKAALGRIVTAEDVVTAAPVAGLMAAFGHDVPEPRAGDFLPPLWHGLFCTAKLPPSRLGADGLARDEGLLPAAADYPNKLFGGARFDFREPIRIGDEIRKESEVMSFDLKTGKSGTFIVGLIEHRVITGRGIAVTEQNDIIFRPPAAAPAAIHGKTKKSAAPPIETSSALWTRAITPDPVLMFRHSAVTFNSHRIHYDRDYVREKGYPGLLVQGTLIARLMLDILHREAPDFGVSSFSFRSGRPIYDNGDFRIEASPANGGDEVTFRALDSAGNVGMTALAARVAV
jgi:3-methylfumaryl-CoA hydratase